MKNCNDTFGIYDENKDIENPLIKGTVKPRESENLTDKNFVPLDEKCCEKLKNKLGEKYYNECLKRKVYRIRW